MPEDVRQQIKDAQDLGEFQGTVKQALSDIKQKLDDINAGRYSQDVKIALKADKTDLDNVVNDVSDLKKKVYQFIGAAAVISSILSLLGAAILRKFI